MTTEYTTLHMEKDHKETPVPSSPIKKSFISKAISKPLTICLLLDVIFNI